MCTYIEANPIRYPNKVCTFEFPYRSNRSLTAASIMRNPVDRAIRAMTLGAGVVGLIVLIVFQLL